MDYRKMFNPIPQLYVPSGWCIEKNHIFKLDKNVFLKIKDKNEIFLVKEYFISECVFYAKSELSTTTTKFLGIVDIGCKLISEENFSLVYDINFWLHHKKKKSTLIYEEEHKANNPNDALKLASLLMQKLSHGELKIEGYNLKS
ncbi:MAG: hypothetical protein ACWA5U_04420 [bacterium]